MSDRVALLKKFVQRLRQKLKTHAVRITMHGYSMMPTIKSNQKVVIINKSHNEVEPGEIVLFLKDEQIILHRIIYKENVDGIIMFLTRGDNCDTLDNWVVYESDILGIAQSINESIPSC